MQEVETTLYHIPKPNRHHLDTLQQLLLRVEREWGSGGQAGEKRRADVADAVQSFLANIIPGIVVYVLCMYEGFNF